MALSHSMAPNGRGGWLGEHLASVSRRAAQYGTEFGAGDEAAFAGLLHDLGKYGELFQKRLKGEARGIDHWSMGAWVALDMQREKGIAAALAIQGHHIGLQRADDDSLGDLNPSALSANHPLGLRLSEADVGTLLSQFSNDGLAPKALQKTILSWTERQHSPAATMLDLRMLYSALVDADFIETEAHFNSGKDGQKRYRAEGPALEADRILKALQDHLADLSRQSKASKEMRRLRNDLLNACLAGANRPPGLFTLTAPTGSGKTLALLAFALKRAELQGQERIVVVLPYLTIIDQTVLEYQKVLKRIYPEETLPSFLIQDHSLAGTRSRPESSRGRDQDAQNGGPRPEDLLAENWDAPIIITTSVQFFESLFSNRPSSCRKLHRLAKSVVLFDEAQTFPLKLVLPTLATLSHLCARYDSTVVFSTATQPAFDNMTSHVRIFSRTGWQPSELAPPSLDLFSRVKRWHVSGPDFGQPKGWDELAKEISTPDTPQVLFIVNVKRHARQMHDCLKQLAPEGLFHLSTSMCPAHRKQVLDSIRDRLDEGVTCRLVATQCVEAGVDLDFPIVYRAWGPLDAIAQAAGRCNRNGRDECGQVRIFLPREEAYPGGAYVQAERTARTIIGSSGIGDGDLASPDLFRNYYRSLYAFARPQAQSVDLQTVIRRQDFVETNRLYRIIDTVGVNVLVPYDSNAFQALAQEARQEGLTASWIARASPYSVGLYQHQRTGTGGCFLEPIPLARGGHSEEWFIYLREEDYHPDVGLVLPDSSDALVLTDES